MLPTGYVTHHIDGRLRIRIPSKQRDAAYFARLQEALGKCEGIESLQVNPLTGSVLLLHHVDLSIIARCAEQGEVFLLAQPAPALPVTQQIAGRFHSLDQGLQRTSAGKLDLGAAAFFGLTLAALYQLLRRNVWPAGVSLLWYAASLLPKPGSFRSPEGKSPAS